MKKQKYINQINWVFGILLCTLGIAFCTKADFGLSMIAAPAYIIHVKMVEVFPWYSQGTSEYILQTLLIIIVFLITRKFKIKYILSFATAVISGLVLDMWLFLLGGNGAYELLSSRSIAFILGECLSALAIALFFRTTMPVQAYELLVSEIAKKFNIQIDKVKMFNDICYFVLSFALALLLNGSLQGFGIGTIVITLTNAPIIALFGKLIDKFIE